MTAAVVLVPLDGSKSALCALPIARRIADMGKRPVRIVHVTEEAGRSGETPESLGLKPADLHEGRDLKPTIDLRAVLKGVLRDHLRVDEVALATSVFPGSDDAKPMAGLLA